MHELMIAVLAAIAVELLKKLLDELTK